MALLSSSTLSVLFWFQLLWPKAFAFSWSPTAESALQLKWQSGPLGAVVAEAEVETPSEEAEKLEASSTIDISSPVPRRALAVSSEIELPFTAEVAFDAFADLHRQPEWSPWLHNVEYLDDNQQTKWTLRVLGVSYSWISVATNTDRPYLIEWESVSGLKNFGQVQFEPLANNRGAHMTMTMTFVPPRVVSAVFRNSKGVQHFMERTLLGSSLRLFRDVIVDEILFNTNTTTLFLPI